MSTPFVSLRKVSLPPPSSDDKRADLERLIESTGIEDLSILPSLLKVLPETIRKSGFHVSLVISEIPPKKVISVDANRCYAIALDIGSTNLVASVMEMSGQDASEPLKRENPQVSFGRDILTRIQLAMGGRGEELRKTLIGGINALIQELLEENGIRPEDVYALTISANTTMAHFLHGLPVENIPVEPYIPVAHEFPTVFAGELSIGINPDAIVYTFPNAGSYVGGDIISGILSSGLHRKDAPTVLIDVGTNAEIVIGNRDWILVGAGAAGPALEDGIFRSGKKADKGSIYKVTYNPQTGRFLYKTIGDAPPEGLCGSGVVDLIYELYSHGLIDNRGRFTDKAETVLVDGEGSLKIIPEMDIMITEREIDNFLRSKAGMFASLAVLVHTLGLGFQDIEEILIAGALGTGLDAGKAVALGMLPDIPPRRFKPLGNTAIRGAEMLLGDVSLLKEVKEIREKITYMEMNTSSEFMQEFPGALYIPHADPEKLRN